MDRVRDRLRREMPHMSGYYQSGGFIDAVLNFGMPAPIDVQVSGSDLESAYRVASHLADGIRRIRGVNDILIPQDLDNPALQIDVDRARAAQMGLSEREVISNV